MVTSAVCVQVPLARNAPNRGLWVSEAARVIAKLELTAEAERQRVFRWEGEFFFFLLYFYPSTFRDVCAVCGERRGLKDSSEETLY